MNQLAARPLILTELTRIVQLFRNNAALAIPRLRMQSGILVLTAHHLAAHHLDELFLLHGLLLFHACYELVPLHCTHLAARDACVPTGRFHDSAAWLNQLLLF